MMDSILRHLRQLEGFSTEMDTWLCANLTGLYSLVAKKFDGDLPPWLIEEVAADFDEFIRYRAVTGNRPCISNTAFDCYLANGFPCGWTGEYPNGRMVVYSAK